MLEEVQSQIYILCTDFHREIIAEHENIAADYFQNIDYQIDFFWDRGIILFCKDL